MTLTPVGYILWVLSPYLTILSALYFAKREYPAWVVRKTIHVFGLINASLIAGLNTLFDAIVISVLFMVTFLGISFSGIAPLYQFLVDKGTRDGESKAISYLNSMLTVLVGLIIMLIFVEENWIFMSSMLSIAIGDGMGEVIGRTLGRHPYRIIRPKTVEGSLGVYFGTLVALFVPYLYVFGSVSYTVVWIFLIVSLGVVILEAFSWAFLDNLSIPIFVSAMLFFLV